MQSGLLQGAKAHVERECMGLFKIQGFEGIEMFWGTEMRGQNQEQLYTINCSILFCQDWK